MNNVMNIFSLDEAEVFVASNIESNDFKEFCESLDELNSFTDISLYLEEVEDREMTIKNAFKGTLKNTADTTIDIGSAYGNVVSGNAKLIKSTWDLMMRAVGLFTRVIGFILSKISYIPKAILKVGNKIADLPSDIKNKIQGNIKLYITVNDIDNLYNKMVINEITTFISLSKRLSEGEFWGTTFNKRKSKNNSIIKMNENDIKICKNMHEKYNKLKMIEFNQTTIQMNYDKSRETYFGSSSVINFTDLHGKKHNCTYYEALIQLVEDIKSLEGDLKTVRDSVSDKYTLTQMNQSFSNLNWNHQRQISSTIQMMSKIFTITGNIIRYILIDINTIEKEADVLLKSSGVKLKTIKTKPIKK